MTRRSGLPPWRSSTAGLSFAETELGLQRGLYPFESKFLDWQGTRLHYIDEGGRPGGPVLFMLHGNPTWSFLYRHLVATLGTRFRCIAMDLPGFGLSRPAPGFSHLPEAHRDHVVALLHHLDLTSATLVAHDWGGPIGLAAALAAPKRLTRFVLGNTWAWPVNGNLHFEWFAALMGGPLGRWAARRFNLFVNGVMPAFMRRGALPRAVMHAYRAPFRRSGDVTGTHVLPACITASRAFLTELEDGLRVLDGQRFLFLWPDRDIAFRATELRRWQVRFPAAKVIGIKRCGHFLWEEAAEEAAAAIIAWHGDAPRDAAAVAYGPSSSTPQAW
jgi:haloalkane dehalogenase